MRIDGYNSNYTMNIPAVRQKENDVPAISSPANAGQDSGTTDQIRQEEAVQDKVQERPANRNTISVNQYQQYLMASRGPKDISDSELDFSGSKTRGMRNDLEQTADKLMENISTLLEDMRNVPDIKAEEQDTGKKIVFSERNVGRMAERVRNQVEQPLPNINL